MAETNDNPAFAEVNNSLRKAWAQKITVNNPVAAVRDIAPLLARLRSAAHVAVFGPALAGHQHCNAVMWDANTFTGHDVAFEAAELICNVLESCLMPLPQHEINRIAINSAMRRLQHLDRFPPSASPTAESFISADKPGATTLYAEIALVQCSSAEVVLRFDQKTGRLLCVQVPIGCSVTSLVNFLQSKINEFISELERFDCIQTNFPYKNTMRTLILSSIASLTVLIQQDLDCMKLFCEKS